MAVNAFVLPYPGRSVGVVFWERRRAPQRRAVREPTAEEEPFAIYAPGELSQGEIAELQARYVASLGQALRDGDRYAMAGGVLIWWWGFGLLAAALLALRALEFGPGYAWLALAAAVTALPLVAGDLAWPFRPRRAALARRLARRAPLLTPVTGTDPRHQERVSGTWRLARRLRGPAHDQLRELEGYCREQAWRDAAAFYADQYREAAPSPAVLGRLAAWWGRFSRRFAGARTGETACATLEMRAW